MAKPTWRMNPVRDSIDLIPGKHAGRRLSVLLGDTVHIAAQIEGKVRHVELHRGRVDAIHIKAFHTLPVDSVEDFGARSVVKAQNAGIALQHIRHETQRELIVSCGNRRMGREYALVPHALYVLGIRPDPACLSCFHIEELEDKKARVTFIHVEPFDVGIAESIEKPDPAYPEEHFLRETISLVAAVEVVSE